MGFIDKLKNVFFEEVDEDDDDNVDEVPLKLAKKIEIPKRKERVIEKNENVDEDFFSDEKNIRSSKVQKYIAPQEEQSQVEDVDNETINNKIPMMFEEEDFFDNTYREDVKEEVKPIITREERLEKRELYQGKKEPSYVESVSKPYTNTSAKSYYDNKESKGFKPSPIISPIYGVLDKNYRKEEVVTKKDSKPINSYRKVDLDSVRNKAFGNDEEKVEVKEEKKVKVEIKQEEKTLYDVNKSKPDVDKITLAEADEYYNDLGLAYNVDYNDSSRSNVNTRTKRYHEDKQDENEGNDNLFDLIDLMYNKED